ncbi:hypothetical protein DPEC_G00299640 [Dallia pectoralis]|uniref:Uncharacterized protein n=1 Tax=Dallia pectoralis TaxID=75939 RepID=A0ACC2FGJ2_DALPE|nr:hypothetical protein DPEC_G00299640 [Dallia pectoralis]
MRYLNVAHAHISPVHPVEHLNSVKPLAFNIPEFPILPDKPCPPEWNRRVDILAALTPCDMDELPGSAVATCLAGQVDIGRWSEATGLLTRVSLHVQAWGEGQVQEVQQQGTVQPSTVADESHVCL